MFSSKKDASVLSFSLWRSLLFIALYCLTMDQGNLLWSFKQEKEGVMDVLSQISPSLVRSAGSPLSFQSCYPGKGCQHSNLFFSMAIFEILLPFTISVCSFLQDKEKLMVLLSYFYLKSSFARKHESEHRGEGICTKLGLL